ncbi:hypothetical protein [Okibacterium endophyticum]
MATLERRVQILLDPAQYAVLEAEAHEKHRSIASIIRESIDERLDRGQATRRRAAADFVAYAQGNTGDTSLHDWREGKQALDNQLADTFRDIP